MAKFHASASAAVSERERRNMERARKIASQGMVLLENRGVLPLAAAKNILHIVMRSSAYEGPKPYGK